MADTSVIQKKNEQSSNLSSGKFMYVIVLLGCIPCLCVIENSTATALFPLNSHVWITKLALVLPILIVAFAGIQVWKDVDRGEMKQKTAGLVLATLGAVLMVPYTILTDIAFRN